MVKFYDENMNEVYLPKDTDLHYGSYPLELNISSIEYEKQGQKRVSIGRQASLSAFIIASRETDMKLKIKRVYEFFRLLEEFYVADGDTPYELLKVSVEQTYTIGFGNGTLIDFEIPLTVHKPYFKQSLHTTLDIDSEGVRWNDKWGFGMGLSSETEQWKYSFEPEKSSIPTPSGVFKDGGITIFDGKPNESNANNIFSDFIMVTKGTLHRFEETLNHSNVNFWRIFEYEDGNFIGYIAGNDNSNFVDFIARGNQIRVSTSVYANMPVRATNVGETLNPTLVRYNNFHKFRFYNAGTEEIKLIQQKESEIRIDIKSSVNWLEIHDGKQTFRLNRAVKSGDTLIIRGHQILLNENNVAGNSNRVFLTVKKGWNDWEVRGLGNFKFSINFRFLYD